jgi:hypothetical protein
MNRRALLATLGAGVCIGATAGCLGRLPERETYSVAIASQGEMYGVLGASARVVDAEVSSLNTAFVEVTVENRTDEALSFTVDNPERDVFGGISDVGPGELVLATTSEVDEGEGVEFGHGCWTLPSPPVAATEVLRPTTVEGGETASTLFGVFANGALDGERCPTGWYRFNSPYRLLGDEHGREWTWGLTLRIE